MSAPQSSATPDPRLSVAARKVPCAEECTRELLQFMAEINIEIHLSVSPPPRLTDYSSALKCPHGVAFFYEPTAAQIAIWRREHIQ